MTARRLKREELAAADRIRSISFHFPLNEEEAEKKQAEASEEWLRQSWGCFEEDGTLTACIINNDFNVLFDGHVVKMGGIGGVATLPEYRYGGAVRTIFARLLREAREEGEVFSTLYPFSHEFYRKLGYEQFLPLIEYRFSPDLLQGYRHTGWTKRLHPGDDIAPLRELYDVFSKKYNMMVVRADDRYRLGNPFRDGSFTVLLGDERGARAFMTYQTDKEDGGNTLNVRDTAYLDAEDFRMCLGYLSRMSADYKKVRLMLPEDVPLRMMVPRPYDLTVAMREQPMARITNAPKALELMNRPESAEFTVRVEDEFLGENSGCWRVTAKGAEPTEQDADLEVSSRALTLLVLGSADLCQAEFRPDVKVNGNRETLEKVFVRKPLYLADYF